MQDKLQSALALASKGFYVFPIQPDSKVPPQNLAWREESTCDAEKIQKWWQQNKEYNIGLDTGKSGLYVIDVDAKEGKKGDASFRELDMVFGFPDTFLVATPSGGFHLYYWGQGFRNTASRLAPDIDTRGEGGYVLAPGSTINGKAYEVTKRVKPAVLPAWITERLAEYRSEAQQKNKEVFSVDDKKDIARAIAWLKESAELAVEGAGGDSKTFATAARCRDFGLSADKTLEVMLAHWNNRCSPPWAPEELKVKVNNAYNYASRAQGAASAHADFDVAPAEHDEMFPLFDDLDEFSIPPRAWVFGRLAIRKKVSIMVAPPGAGKSTLTMLMALSKSTGKDFLNLMGKCKRGVVVVHNNEDDLEELQRRMKAQIKHYGIARKDLFDNDAAGDASRGMLYMGSGEHYSLKVAARSSQGSKLIESADVQRIIDRLISIKAEWLIVDPFSETHPASENDNNEILEVAKIYRHIAQAANVAVTLVHHDRKPEGASSDGHVGNMYSARGASSLAGVARIMYTFHTMSEKDAKKYGIDEHDRRYYVRLDFAKANLSLSIGEPTWFKRVSQRIGAKEGDPDSGEEVGVLEAINLIPKREMPDSSTYDLILDIETLVQDGREEGVAISELSRDLSINFPTHNGKNTIALQRTIKRLFDDGQVNGANGKLYLKEVERKKGEPVNKPTLYVCWYPKDISALL